MKPLLHRALLAIAGLALLSPAAFAVVTAPNDLIIAFYEVDSNNVVSPNTYVYNMGQASLYRENTASGVGLSSVNSGLGSSNIGADLSSTFGSDWATSGTVRWVIIGGLGQSDAVGTTGDNQRTTYVSRPASTVGELTTAPSYNGSQRGTLSNSATPFRETMNGAGTPGANAAGAVVPTTVLNDISDYLNPTATLNFGVAGTPYGVLGEGDLGTGVEGGLDIWRMVHGGAGVTAPTDLTSGFDPGTATAGTGQYIGRILIDSSGNLTIVNGAIPEPSAILLAGLGGLAFITRRKRSV